MQNHTTTHPNSSVHLQAVVELVPALVMVSVSVKESDPAGTTCQHSFRYTDLHWPRNMHQHDNLKRMHTKIHPNSNFRLQVLVQGVLVSELALESSWEPGPESDLVL